jgi:excisionase family DNA binding protein
MTKILLDETDVARLFGVTARRVQKLAKAGDLPSVHLPGGELRFDPDDLETWITAHKQPAKPAGVPA